MFYNSIKFLHVSLAVVCLMGAGALSVTADLGDATLSVYYNFDGNGDTVEDGSIYGNDGKIEGKVAREDGVIEKAIVLEPKYVGRPEWARI